MRVIPVTTLKFITVQLEENAYLRKTDVQLVCKKINLICLFFECENFMIPKYDLVIECTDIF